jgi:hypothetical protein
MIFNYYKLHPASRKRRHQELMSKLRRVTKRPNVLVEQNIPWSLAVPTLVAAAAIEGRLPATGAAIHHCSMSWSVSRATV